MTVRLILEQPCPTCGGTLQTRSLWVGDAGLKFVRSIPCPDCGGTGVRVSPVSCAGCRWYEADSGGDLYCWSLGIFSEPDWGCLSWTAKEGTDGR